MTRFSRTVRIVSATLAAVFVAYLGAPRAALADGAASTRNILFGAAAAGAGTLLIINHNKKVHQKYAEDDRRQAATQAQANDEAAAYASERQAYAHEAVLVGEYQKEVAYQHRLVHRQALQIASLRRSLVVAKRSGAPVRSVALAGAAPAARSTPDPASQLVSYGWGAY